MCDRCDILEDKVADYRQRYGGLFISHMQLVKQLRKLIDYIPNIDVFEEWQKEMSKDEI